MRDKPIYFGYGDYAIRLIYYALREGFVLREVPVVYEFRLGGESKTQFSRQLINYTRAVLALRFSRGLIDRWTATGDEGFFVSTALQDSQGSRSEDK